MKFRPNDPCWCGSGKKYKKCHRFREDQEPLEFSDGLAAIARSKKNANCNCPPDETPFCKGKPIGSHSISKSLGIRKIAEHGHVLGLKHDAPNLKKNAGRPSIGAIGIGKISVFPGFCRFHDKKLFSPIEDVVFDASPEQCSLLSYRAIAREKYTKVFGINLSDYMKISDRGRSFIQQVAIQNLMKSFQEGMYSANRDLQEAIEMHFFAVKNRDYSNFSHAVIKLSNNFPILCSTAHMPHEDWKGDIVQDISDSSIIADWVSAVSIRTTDDSWVIFTWRKGSEKISRFVKTLNTHHRTNIGDALVKYFFSISENLAIDPFWWRSLDDEKRRCLEERIIDGHPVLPNDNIIFPKNGEPVVFNSDASSFYFI